MIAKAPVEEVNGVIHGHSEGGSSNQNQRQAVRGCKRIHRVEALGGASCEDGHCYRKGSEAARPRGTLCHRENGRAPDWSAPKAGARDNAREEADKHYIEDRGQCVEHGIKGSAHK